MLFMHWPCCRFDIIYHKSATFYWSVCTKLAVMYMCVRGVLSIQMLYCSLVGVCCVVIKYRERDVQVWKHVKVYFKWGSNMSPFDINSVVFHFNDSVNTHLNHRRIFLFSTPCGVGSILCMRNINCKPHWLAICCLSRIFNFFLDRQFRS
jgi:hypothetical protein